MYEDDPFTVVDATNVLGVFTPGGSVRIGTSAPDDIVIDGTLMTSAPSGVVQVDNYDSGWARGTATILGGIISTYYGAFGTFSGGDFRTGYRRNFMYDQRLNGGLAPPYFPTTMLFLPATFSNNPVLWDSIRRYIPGNSASFQMPSSEPEFNPDFS